MRLCFHPYRRLAVVITLLLSAAVVCPSVVHAAASFKVGSFTKNTATGSQTIAHGLGTTPKAMIFWTQAATNTSFNSSYQFGYGITDGTTSKTIASASQDGVTTSNSSRRIADKVIAIVQWGEVTVAEASFTSWDATNLVINWTTNDANADVIHYIAIGGSDVTAKVVNWTVATSTGNQSVTGVGFRPDFVLHAYGGNQLTGVPPASTASGGFGLGAMNILGDQWANHVFHADGLTTTDNSRYQRTDKSIAMVTSSQGVAKEASFVSMDSNGFTLNWTTVTAQASQVISLALQGVNTSIGSFNKSTGAATASQSITGTGFTPGVGLFTSVQNTSFSTPQTGVRFGIGASDGTTGGSSAFHDADNVTTTSVDDIDKTTKVFMKVNNDTPTLNAEADLASMDSNGFTLSWTTNDAVATEILYVAFASTDIPPANTVPSAQTTNKNINIVFSSGNGNQISISDTDAGSGTPQVTLTVTNGTLSLSGTTGLTFVTGDGTTDSTMTFKGTVTNINNALNGLTYIPTTNYTGSSTLTITTKDSTLVSLDNDSTLKGHYTFENTGALGTDTSPAAGFPGTPTNATANSDGTRGNVVSFSGTGSIQMTGHFGNPANLTLAAWVNLTTADTSGAEVISLGDSAMLRLDEGGNLKGIFYNGTTWIETTYPVTLAGGGWHHVAYTFDDTNNTVTLYLDGVAVGLTSTTGSISYTRGANSFIGKHGNGGTSWDFNGKIDDARIYSKVLTAGEINALAQDLSLSDTDTVAITVNATPTVAFSASSSSGAEAMTSVSIPVTLSNSSVSTVTVNYAVTGGTASGSGVDYTLSSGTLSFSPGTNTQFITVTVVDDTVSDSNETIQITLSSPSNATLGATTVHTYTIVDSAIRFRAQSSGSVDMGIASLTLNVPAGTVQNDTMIAAIVVRPSTTTITAPGGWTLIRADTMDNTNTAIQALYRRLAGASEPANYTWTFSGSPSGASGGIMTFYGVSTSSPVDTSSGQEDFGTADQTGYSVPTPSITTASAGEMLVTAHSVTSSGTPGFAWTPPVNMTEAFETSSTSGVTGISLEGNYRALGSAGATGAQTAVMVGDDNGDGIGQILALAPASAPTVTLSAGSGSIAEAGGSTTVTATLSQAYGQTVTVSLAFSGTATLNTDYTASASSITISPGSLTGSITLTATQDSIDEANETVIVDISGVTNGTESGTQQVTVTITDDDATPTVAFSSTSSSGAESVTAVTIPVTLSAASGLTVTVDYAVTGGTATGSGTDYTLASGTLTFTAGQTSKNISITVVNDSLDENDETIQITLSNPSNATLGTNTIHTYTILDDDATPTVAFSSTSSSGAESVTAVTIPVTLSAVSGRTVTVDYAVSGGTATGSGTDYTLASGTLTFSAGTTSQNISITVVNDALDENDETIQITLSNPSNATLGANTVHTYTIIDDDATPTVAFSATTSSGAESVTSVTIPVTLSAVSGRTVTVDYAVTGGTATGGGVDYTLASGTLTFTAGTTSQNIAVTVVNDTLNETNETIQITLSNPSNATLGANTVHTYTITDDDAAPTVTLSLSGSPMAEAGGVATVTATLSAASGQTVTVNLGFSGTATQNTDYTASASSITINAGSTTGSMTLTAIQDTIDEPNETIIVDITTVTNGTESGTQQVTATITDDDAAPTVTLSLSGSPMAEAGGVATVTATLSAVSGQNVTVNLGFSGTATQNIDYTASASSITINAGSTTGSITLTAIQDSIDEPDETIIVDITSVTNGTEAGTQQVTATITDDDAAPTVTLSLSGSPMAEAGGVATVTATLSAVSGQNVTVNLGFSGTATINTDYTASASSITIPAGSTTGSITLTAIQDAINEANETIIVDITTVTNGTESGTQQVTATITDDDAAPTVTLSLSGSPMAEAAGVATVTATLSAVSGQDVTVNLGFSGTATINTDYTASASSITITAGSTTGSITLTAIQDSIDEPNETIIVDITTVTNGTESGTQQVTATITDDDAPPSVTLSLSGSPMAEAGGTATVTATLSAVSGRDVTVNLAFSGTATINTDYTASASSITITAGGTTGSITLTAIQDSIDEPNETIIVDITTVTNGTESGTQQVTATITDDDATPSVEFNAASSSGAESVTSVTIPVSLSAASGQTVTVDYAVTGGTATGGGTDYTLASGTLTFGAGTTSQNISITVVNDSLDENDETIQITLSNPSNATLGTNTVHTYTITDDDATPTVAFNATSSSGAETVTSVTIPVSLSAVSGRTVTVDYAVTGGTATGGGVDYTLASGTLTFTAGSTSQNIAITVVNDATAESDETIQITLSNPSNATLGANTVHTYTIVDDESTPTVSLTISGSPMAENGGTATVTATLSGTSAQNVTVNLGFSGTATLTDDYTRSGTSITITAGNTTGTITLTAVQDSIDEPDETIIVDISSATNATPTSPTQVTATITDDDSPPTVSLSLSGSPMAEAAGVATVTATLSAASGKDVTVNLSYSGTATLTTDYTRSGTSIAIPAGSTTGTITLTAVQDTIDEPDETIIVDIASATNADLGATTQVTATITDDDATPTVSLSLTGSPMAHEGGLATVTATLSAVSGQNVTVNLGFTGTAVLNTDYSVSANSITIPAGSTTASMTVTALPELENDPDETVIVTITGATNATASGVTQVTAIIRQIIVDYASSAAGSGTSLTWNHTVSSASPNRILIVGVSLRDGVNTVTGVTYGLQDMTFLGEDTSDDDNVRMEMWYLIAPAAGTDSIVVNLSGNSKVVAGAASFTGVDQSVPFGDFNSNGSSVAGTAPTVTITSAPNETIVDTVASEQTAGLTTADVGQSEQWNLISGGTGTDTRGGGSIKIGSALTTMSWTLNTASRWAIGAVGLRPAYAPSVSLSLSGSPMVENGGQATVTATLSATSGYDITVNLGFSGTATLNTDYTASGNAITILAGSTTGTVTLTAIQDAIDEPNETVIVDITSVINGTESGTQQVTATITDDDATPTVAFDATSSNGVESATSVNIPVSLSAASGQTITVDYAVTGGTATGGGTDYTLASGTLTFTPGQTSKNIALTVVDDSLNEANETIQITLSNPSNATLGTNDIHTYTINDNDTAPTVAFDATSSSATESVTSVTIPVSLSTVSGQTITVDYAVTGGTATGGGTDYTLANGTLTFTPGQTSKNITITIVDDALNEDDEPIQITLSNPSNATLGTNTVHTYTILDDDPLPSVSFNAASASAAESVTPANLSVSLSAPSGRMVTVDYAVTGGTATGGGVDYVLASGTLIFSAGQTSKTIPITIVDDALDEPNETIVVGLANPTNATFGVNDTHTYTITDDDPPPSVAFNAASSSGLESVTTVNIPVSLSVVSGQTVLVDYAVTGGTATGGGVDYTLASGTLTFTPGTTSQNVIITVNDDALDESNETIQITLSNPLNATLGTNTDHTYTITDDDATPTVAFDATTSSGAESVTTVNIPVSLSSSSGQTITVDYAVTGGTATGSGTDYTLANGTLTFTPGQTSKNITITVVNDSLNETDETIQITLSNPSNANLGTNTVHTHTILDDDATPTVAFDATSSSGAESSTSVSIAVSLSAASGQTVTVDYAVTGGTATGSGTDYTLASGTLTFNPGTTTRNITVTVVDDALDEADETIQITLSNPGNALLGTNTVHTYTINDDDPPPSVAFDVVSSNGGEGATPANLAVSLSAPSGQMVTVDYAVTGGTATGGGTDYVLVSGTLIFSASQTTKQIPITIVDDALDEPNETIQVTLSNPSNATLGTNTVHTYTINDDDPPPSVAFDATGSNGLESATTVTIPVSLSAVSGKTVLVDYAVTGGTATGGGTDYTLASGTLTFAPGTTSQSITFTVNDDALDEVNETIQITLSNPSNATLGTNTDHVYTILDDDATPSVAFDATSSSGAESVTTVNIPVSLSASSGQTVTVDYAVTGGTATGSGTDYTLASGTLTFTPGQTSKNITITVVNDSIDEPDETIQVTLSNSSNANLGANTSHTYTILDDDNAPSVAFNATSSSGAESVTSVTIPVSLSSVSGLPITVDYAVTGGTATGSGTDYSLASSTLTFNAGTTTQNITISVVNDALNEADETIQVTLSNPNNATLGTNTVHTYTITDDDPPPSVAFDVVSSNGGEGTTPANLSLSLSAPSGQMVTVDYAVTGGTATGGGTDYVLASGTLIFSAGQTTKQIPITIIDDALDEPDETIQVTLSNPSNATLGTNTVHTYTINDDDPPPSVAFDTPSSNGSESVTTVNIPVSLSAVSGQTVQVDYAVTNGTATGGGVDYTLASGTLTFVAGTTTQNIVLTVVNDALDEPNETIQITLSNPSNATVGTNSDHIYTIVDDDNAVTVAFSAASSNSSESVTSVTIPVALSVVSGQTVTVDYAVTGGTATGSGVDYTLASGTLTFNPGTTTRNITLTVINDALNEADETIQITLSNPSNATLGAGSTHTYTILDDDAAPTVAFSATASSGAESTTSVTIPVALSAASGQTVTVDYGVTGGTATGGGVDYTLANGTLTFSAGTTSQNIAVTVVNDALNETNETIQITLSNPSNATLGANAVHTYTILDDDAAPNVTLSIAGASMAEAAGAATVTATLSAPSGQDVTVNLAFSGTATLNTDYTASGSSVTILAGNTTGSITLTAIQDAIDEPNETIVVDVTSVTNASTLTPQQVTATIVDDDSTPTVVLSIANASMAESGGSATVTATLSGVSSQDVTINLSFGGTATLNTDYTVSSSAITVLAGGLTGSMTLTALADAFNESNETIVVTIGSVLNAAELGTQQVTATIIDDDGAPSVSLSIAGSAMAEANGVATVTATLSATSGQTVTVGLGFSGSATLNSDYVASSSTITIPAGALSGAITLTAIQDAIDEGNETIVVTMGAVTNATAAGVQIVTATIIDDDGPNVAFNLAVDDTPDPVQPGGQITYTLTYGNATTANQTALQVTLRNTLPANTTLVSASNGGTLAAGVVTWTLGDLAPGASGTRTLVVQVNSPLPNGTVLTDQATLQDNASASLSASQTTTVQSAPILGLTVDDTPDPVQAGSQITYTLTYSNSAAANQTAPSVTLINTLPANTTFVSASNGGVFAAGGVSWNIGDLAPGDSGTRTLLVQVNSPLPNGTILPNQAALQDNQSHSATASQSTTVQSASLLALSVTDSPDPVAAGGQITYSLTISNAGTANQTANSIALSDTLSSNVTFVSASDGGVLANGIVTWNIASLAPGASATRTLVVKLNSGVNSGTLITNAVNASAGASQSANAQSSTTVQSGGGGFVTNTNASNSAETGPTTAATAAAATDASTAPTTAGAQPNVATPTPLIALPPPAAPPSPQEISRTPSAPLVPPNQAPNFAQPNFGRPRCSTMLSLSGSHSPQPALAGGQLAYTFNYVNLSTIDTVRDVALHSFLPKESLFVSASDGGVGADDNSAYWHLGDLPPGARGTRTVVAKVKQLDVAAMLLVHNHAILENGSDNCAQTVEAATIQVLTETDKDGDGFPDEDERRCGSNPFDPHSSCFTLELAQRAIRIQRGADARLNAIVKARFSFAGEVAITPNNSLTGTIWHIANASASLGPKKMSESVSFGLQTTNNTPLGLHQVPIWAVSGRMATAQILTVEVVP